MNFSRLFIRRFGVTNVVLWGARPNMRKQYRGRNVAPHPYLLIPMTREDVADVKRRPFRALRNSNGRLVLFIFTVRDDRRLASTRLVYVVEVGTVRFPITLNTSAKWPLPVNDTLFFSRHYPLKRTSMWC